LWLSHYPTVIAGPVPAIHASTCAELSMDHRDKPGDDERGSILPYTHPLPASPIEGEVPFGGPGNSVPKAQGYTSPSMGEAGRGWGHTHQPLKQKGRPRAPFSVLSKPDQNGLFASRYSAALSLVIRVDSRM